MLDYIYPLDGNIAAKYQTNKRKFHLGIRDDSSLGWLTDYGD